MVEEFDLPMEIIDRKVTKMKMISPSNREVDVGKTLNEREWIGMCRREIFDDFLRKRAVKNGAKVNFGMQALGCKLAQRVAAQQLYSTHTDVQEPHTAKGGLLAQERKGEGERRGPTHRHHCHHVSTHHPHHPQPHCRSSTA